MVVYIRAACFAFCFAAALSVVPMPAGAYVSVESIHLHTNLERYRAGEGMLTRHPLLDVVAERKARDILTRQYFAHESPDGVYAADVAEEVGYAYLSIAENLALGTFTHGSDVVAAWMASRGHRENILTSGFSDIGLAALRGDYGGRDVWVAVQIFGIPASACPLPDAAQREEIRTLERVLALLRGVVEEREQQARSAPGNTAAYEAYADTVRMYNAYVERQRSAVEEYNADVAAYRACAEEL